MTHLRHPVERIALVTWLWPTIVVSAINHLSLLSLSLSLSLSLDAITCLRSFSVTADDFPCRRRRLPR
jgi:hypothetical protein